jgi:hypothetical protein
MKMKIAFLLAAALMLGSATVALGKGRPFNPHKPARTTPTARTAPAPKGFRGELRALGITCPATSVELQGAFGSAGDGFIALVVSKATGKASTLAGKQVALRLLRSTKITRNGPTTAAHLKAGDRLSVVALVCSQGLVARTVTATAKKA